MDKYEYKLKAEEIVRLAGKKQYKAAAKLADDIRWEKVKNIQMLCTVSEIYERIGKYDESREVLGLAYTRSPNSKTIVYRMTKLSIALKDYQEATDLYHEYVQLAPNDSNVLTLKYRLYKGRGAKLDTLIAILEEFKSRDYQEEWILELARLYHQAGQGEKCVDICNEIDLWFNDGPSVIKALELKRKYTPLTPMQERKLKNGQAPANKSKEKEESAAEPENLPEEVSVRQEVQPKPEPYKEEPELYTKPESYTQSDPYKSPESYAQAEPSDKPESHAGSGSYTKPESYTRSEPSKKPELYTKPEFHTEPKVQTVLQAEPIPLKREERAQRLPEDVPLAEALIRMARPETDKELKRGFSIIPKGKVVSGSSEEFAFALPDGVKEVELHVAGKESKNSADLPDKQEEKITEEEHTFDKKSSRDKAEDEPSEHEERTEPSEESSEEEFKDDYPEEKPVKHSMGLLEKVFSRLKLEDDEMDDDFNDDYDDDDEEEDDTDPEKAMISRGLTGQYEKVVIDDEEEDEEDPLNVWMNDKDEENEEEDEYEYVYGDEDEEEEYEEINDEYEGDEEELSGVRTNKRFRFFRNTLEDEELYEEAEEGKYEEEEVIPLSYAAKYDTLNLQKELAKSIQQLMDATEKETVDSTLENVKKMVQESHIPELTETMRFKAIRGGMLNHVARRQAEKLEQARDIEEVVAYHASNPEEGEERHPAEDATVVKADARPKPMAELAIKLKPVEEEISVPIEKILTQTDDGQLCILMPEEKEEEEQIEGQLNIEDVLREWEKQELLSENDREKRALEEARKRALEETQDIMTEIMVLLKDVIPKIGSIKDGEEKMSDLAQSLERIQKSLPFTDNIVQAAEESKVAASAIEAACAEAVIELERMEGGEKGKDSQAVSDEKAFGQHNEAADEMPLAQDVEMYRERVLMQDAENEWIDERMRMQDAENEFSDDMALAKDAEEEPFDELSMITDENEVPIEEAMVFEDTDDEEEPPIRNIQEAFQNMEQSLLEEMEESRKRDMLDGSEYFKEQMDTDSMYAENGEPVRQLMDTQDLWEEGAENYTTAAEEEAEGDTTAVEEYYEQEEQEVASPIDTEGSSEDIAVDNEGSNELMPEMREVVRPKDKKGIAGIKGTKNEEGSRKSSRLNDEQKDILAYFLSIRSIQPVLESIVKRTESSPEHMIITGEQGSGKTSVAMRIIKAAQVNKADKIETIAKIQAALLNQKKITDILEKVNGGVLIIEKAGSLKPSTVYAIEDALYSNQFYIQIIFVDNKAEMSRLLRSTRSFINDIQMRVDLPVYTNNELVEFARKYADVNGYAFDGMAILALHSAIDMFQTDQHAANLEDVKKIMNEAMEHADKRSKKLFGKLFGKKNNDGVVLLESDFE